MESVDAHRIFLSVAGSSGKDAAHQLLAQWTAGSLGSSDDFWFYDVHSTQGSGLREEYLRRLCNSHFYVPVLTADFCASTSPYVQEEIATAARIQDEMKAQGLTYNFIVPYLADPNLRPEQLPLPFQQLVLGDSQRTVHTLKLAIESNSGLSTFRTYRRPLENWPDLLFDEDQEPNLMFVLGHTEKEGELSSERVEQFRRWGLIDADLEGERTPQSLRPAQMIPALQRFVHELYLARHAGKPAKLPILPCELDRHLINYRSDLLARHNLLVLGAGDTNWITRAILRHYRHALLSVKFSSPTSSQTIVIDTRDHELGKRGKLTLAQIGDDESAELRYISQVLPKDDLYSAILFSLPNPWNTAKTVIICAGLTGLGTQAAALALTDPSFSVRLGAKRSASAVVIRGKECDWLPVGYEVVY